MKYTKKDISRITKYLKEPNQMYRKEVIELLRERGPMYVEDIHPALKITQPYASQALTALYQMGILDVEVGAGRNSKYHKYSLNPYGLLFWENTIADLLRDIDYITREKISKIK